jgi:hypothetical protein
MNYFIQPRKHSPKNVEEPEERIPRSVGSHLPELAEFLFTFHHNFLRQLTCAGTKNAALVVHAKSDAYKPVLEVVLRH